MQKTQIEKGENAFCSWSKTKKSIHRPQSLRRSRVEIKKVEVDSVEEAVRSTRLPWYFSVGTTRELSFEGRHPGAHDLVDQKEIRGDHRTRVEKLNFYPVIIQDSHILRKGGFSGA